jgi:hypothetical protein
VAGLNTSDRFEAEKWIGRSSHWRPLSCVNNNQYFSTRFPREDYVHEEGCRAHLEKGVRWTTLEAMMVKVR